MRLRRVNPGYAQGGCMLAACVTSTAARPAAAPRPAPPAHLDGRVHRRQLLDLPKQPVPRRRQLLVCGAATGKRAGRLAGAGAGGVCMQAWQQAPLPARLQAACCSPGTGRRPRAACTPHFLPTSAAPVMCCQGRRVSTGVSASYEGVASPRRKLPLYRLRMAMNVSTALVPRPTHTISSPVAAGSSVPAGVRGAAGSRVVGSR